MKKLLVIFLLCSNLSFAQDSWKFTEDKQYHFIAGCWVGVIIPIFVKSYSVPITISTGIIVGGGKEFYDFYSGKGVASFQDFTYTVAGTTCSTLILGKKLGEITRIKFKKNH